MPMATVGARKTADGLWRIRAEARSGHGLRLRKRDKTRIESLRSDTIGTEKARVGAAASPRVARWLSAAAMVLTDSKTVREMGWVSLDSPDGQKSRGLPRLRTRERRKHRVYEKANIRMAMQA